MNEKLKEGLKIGLGMAADIGSGLIVGAACSTFAAPYIGASLLVKGCIMCGKLGLSYVAGGVAKKGIEDAVDDASDLIDGIKDGSIKKVIPIS